MFFLSSKTKCSVNRGLYTKFLTFKSFHTRIFLKSVLLPKLNFLRAYDEALFEEIFWHTRYSYLVFGVAFW